MSSQAAPAAAMATPAVMAAARSRVAPPSEKLSGVTLTMPISAAGRATARRGWARSIQLRGAPVS